MKAEEFLAEIRWTQQHEALRLFHPHGGQVAFIDDVTRDGAFIVITGAGNGWGKSEFLVALFAAVMWPALAPDCFASPALSNWKHPKHARIYSSPSELDEGGSIQKAIKKYFPANRYEAIKGRYSYPQKFIIDNGWTFDLFSYERDPEEAAGPNIGLQAVNEPPPEKLWGEILARSRAGGIIVGGMTSLTGNPWVVDGIFGKANGQDVRVRFGSSCENCIEHGVDGNLSHKNIVRILDQYDADEREARFSGKPLSMSGRILKGFDRSVHIAKEEFWPPSNGVSNGQIVDPAIGKPLAVLWRYVDGAGVLNYYDESPDFKFEGARDSNLTVKEYADIFRSREAGRTISTRILDRHFGNVRRTLGGKTLKEEFADEGIEFQDSYTSGEEVETGIFKIKEYLRYDKTKPIDSLNRPRIRISPRCINLIAALERWGRDPKTGKPMEEYKDFCDLVRYDVMSNPEVEQPVTGWPTSGAHYGVNAG